MGSAFDTVKNRLIGDGTDASMNALLGKRVSAAAADLLDGTTSNVFTVAGGRVLVTALYGVVSVAAVDAAANTLKFQANPTTGTASDMSAASTA